MHSQYISDTGMAPEPERHVSARWLGRRASSDSEDRSPKLDWNVQIFASTVLGYPAV